MKMIENVQEYKVTVEYGDNVLLVTTVYHENQSLLTREEIVEEALGYFNDHPHINMVDIPAGDITIERIDESVDPLVSASWGREEIAGALTNNGYEGSESNIDIIVANGFRGMEDCISMAGSESLDTLIDLAEGLDRAEEDDEEN